jgi:hypothetical protein
MGQTGGAFPVNQSTVKGTLLFSDPGLTNVRQKPWMSRAAGRKVLPRLIEGQDSVDGQPRISGVLVLLPIVLPPANRAKRKRAFGL